MDCYCTGTDWFDLIAALEQEVPLVYVESGMFNTDTPTLVESVGAIPNLGISDTGDSVSDRTWLVVRKDSVVVVRTVDLYSGERRYVIDHGTMPMSVTWRPGGVFEGKVLIKGDLSTTGLNPDSKTLFLMVKAKANKCLLKARGYYLGFEAFEKYRANFRFTDSVTRPREYDLELPHELVQRISKNTARGCQRVNPNYETH